MGHPIVSHVSLKSHIPIRSDPHVLIVGDPGLGKSQLLHACVNIAPRGKQHKNIPDFFLTNNQRCLCLWYKFNTIGSDSYIT